MELLPFHPTLGIGPTEQPPANCLLPPNPPQRLLQATWGAASQGELRRQVPVQPSGGWENWPLQPVVQLPLSVPLSFDRLS